MVLQFPWCAKRERFEVVTQTNEKVFFMREMFSFSVLETSSIAIDRSHWRPRLLPPRNHSESCLFRLRSGSVTVTLFSRSHAHGPYATVSSVSYAAEGSLPPIRENVRQTPCNKNITIPISNPNPNGRQINQRSGPVLVVSYTACGNRFLANIVSCNAMITLIVFRVCPLSLVVSQA